MSRSLATRPMRQVIVEPAEPLLRWVVWVLAQLLRLTTRQDWRRSSSIPSHGGVVVVVNHISNFDPLAFAHYLVWSAGRWPRFLAKSSLFESRLIGWVLRGTGQIRVRRNTGDASRSITDAVAAVQAGRCVVIYPEGTITGDPDLWPMDGKTGAARLALSTGCPVVPVGQWGAQEVWYGRRLGVPRLVPVKTMRLTAGEPVALDDLRSAPLTAEVLDVATDRIMTALTTLVAELRGEQPPVVRWRPT